jgi:hypothetical protein
MIKTSREDDGKTLEAGAMALRSEKRLAKLISELGTPHNTINYHWRNRGMVAPDWGRW